MVEPVVFTAEEVRKLLRLSRSSVYARIADGSIRSIRVGRRILIAKRDLEDLLAGGHQQRQAAGRRSSLRRDGEEQAHVGQ